ncbi:hypothetical protein QFC21_000284 [Naganishia friedmannii]|uniref:Uncharacterized protein n=1 Tax=Naganishia friedmannii TaxID=89922 RepID=A0ACC2WD28_9TREE|nr:hypothetical protein QFC21_000284 [Naganishia friedmannii]
MDEPRSGTSATRTQAQGDIELSPSLSTSPILQGSSVSTPDRAVSELRGESRGRKKNENLPPSRAREVQRAFRARRHNILLLRLNNLHFQAAHLAKLEDRILELENENTELRRLLLLPLPDRGVLGSGPTGRGKSLVEGGVPMSERVKAKRERDRKRAEAAAQARGETLPREKTPDDDTRSKGARAVSAGAVSKKRKLGDGQQYDEDRGGRHVSESFSATPSSSSMGLRSPSVTLPTPISGTTSLPHNVHVKQGVRLPSFSSTSGDVGASRPDSSSSYHHHLPMPPALDTLGNAFGGMSGAHTPFQPLNSASMDSTSSGLVSAALGGRFPNDLHQPFTQQNQDQNAFMNFAAGMINNNQQMGTPQIPNSSLLNSLLAALPGGNGLPGMNSNGGNHNDNFGGNNSNNGNNGLPPLPELLSIILKNPELQRRVLQHQMAQKAQQNQMPQQHMQSFPSSNSPYPGSSSLFGFNAFDNKTNPQLDQLSGYDGQGDNALNMARMDPSALFNDLFTNGRNLQDNSPNSAPGSGSFFMPNLMDTLGMSDQQFSTSLSLPGTDRPPSSAGNDNLLTFDRLFGSQNTGMSNPNLNNPDFLGPSSEQMARPTLPPPPLPSLALKNVFNASSAASNSIARPSSVPLPHRPQGNRSSLSSRGTGGHDSHEMPQSGSADLKGKGKDVSSHTSNASNQETQHPSARTSASAQSASTSKSQPDLLHRLRHCCHLSDVHVTSDPGLLLFASRLCLAVGCDHGGKHDGTDATPTTADSAAQPDAGKDEDYLKLEAAWQLLRQHLDPPSPESSSHPDLPDLTGSGDAGNRGGKPIDGQNQIATGRLAAEMVLRAVRAKTQSHDGEDRHQGGKDMSRWIACRRNPGMSVDRAMIVALVNGFGSN